MGRRRQYGGALHVGLVRLNARKHTPAPVHAHPQTHALANTHTQKYRRITVFYGNKWLVNAPKCYVIRTLRVFFLFSFI